MHMRSASLGGLIIVLTFMLTAAAVHAGTEWHIGSGGTGANSFGTLEELRRAVALGSVFLGDGDVIVLHKDDDSLTDSFTIPNEWKITITSAGGTHTLSSQPGVNAIVFAYQDKPNLTIDNVILSAGLYQEGYSFMFTANDVGGELTISSSLIQNLKYGSWLQGDLTANIINTTFKNNSEVTALYINNLAGDTTNVNITVNQNAPDTITWESGDNDIHAIKMNVYGDANINFNIADGKILDIEKGMLAAHNNGGVINLQKNGGGVLKIDTGWIDYEILDDGTAAYYGSFDFQINEGTVHFGIRNLGEVFSTTGYIRSWDDPFGSITVKEGAVFKPTLDPGNLEKVWSTEEDIPWEANLTWMNIDRFNSEEGARLEIGLISLFPHIGSSSGSNWVHETLVRYRIIDLTNLDVENTSTIASTMRINNKLLDATLKFTNDTMDDEVEPENWTSIMIAVDRLEDLSTLKGVGEYADIYRKLTTLTDPERDMLDSIYARGGLTHSDRAFLQTLSGSIVTNSLLGMRHNWNNLLRKINRRITDYQHEELQELDVTGSEFCRYTEENPVVDYVTMWAGIDQSWMNQTDKDSLAGYDYNPYGVHIGIERHCENLIMGGVIRYDDGTMKLKSNTATKTDITSVLGSAYLSWASEGMYITGSLHAGYGWNESWSNYLMPTLASTAKTGNYSTTLYGAHLEVGYMYETELGDNPIRITPYGGLGYAKMHRQAVTETGAGNLDRHFRRGDWDLWEPSLGVRVAMPIDRGGYMLIPTADLAWTRSTGDSRNDTGDATLLADPSGSWRISTMGGNRSALRFSGGVNAHFARNVTMGLQYDFEWRSHFTSHQLNFNFAMGF